MRARCPPTRSRACGPGRPTCSRGKQSTARQQAEDPVTPNPIHHLIQPTSKPKTTNHITRHAGGPALGRGATTTTEWRLAVQLVELPSARPALAASAPVHLPTADAVVFVYDCADRRTFEAIESLRALAAAHARPEALRAGSGLLLGTKADLERDRKVAALEAVRLGQRLGLPVFECSAMSGVNVEAALASLVRRVSAEWMDLGGAFVCVCVTIYLSTQHADIPSNPFHTHH